MRTVISGICNRHGYYKGSFCPQCDIVGVGESFNLSKDRLWDFHSIALDMPISCKSQWKRELKKRGLHDDVPAYRKGKGLDPKFPHNTEKVRKEIRNVLVEKGIYQKYGK